MVDPEWFADDECYAKVQGMGVAGDDMRAMMISNATRGMAW